MGTKNEVAQEIIVDISSQEAIIEACLKQINKLESENKELKAKLEAIESNKVAEFKGEYQIEGGIIWNRQTNTMITIFRLDEDCEDDETYTVTISKETEEDEKTR